MSFTEFSTEVGKVSRRPVLVTELVQYALLILALMSTVLVDIARLATGRRVRRRSSNLLAIESGAQGWGLIEYEELYRSACEYLGADRVKKIVVADPETYVANLRRSIQELQPTHFFYDPRTGSQKPWRGLWNSFQIAMLFRWYDVTPIAWLTDLPIRTWRRQCIVVTARSGTIITLMCPAQMSAFIPHSRVVGPSLMAISLQRLEFLNRVASECDERDRPAVFIGSLYEPRTAILDEIQDHMRVRGRSLGIQARHMGGERIPNDEYWSRLVRAGVILTTADQALEKVRDAVSLPHFIFRYSEALAAGSLLVAPEVPGIRRYLIPDVHFVSYRTPKEAAEKITFYLDNPELARAVASEGQAKMSSLIRSNCYWATIDSVLGKSSLI